MLKEGKYPKDVRSYRPVALTNILCKIFERMTNKKLVWYLEKEKKIDNRQFGFRKQRITIDAISKIVTKTLDGFRRKHMTKSTGRTYLNNWKTLEYRKEWWSSLKS